MMMCRRGNNVSTCVRLYSDTAGKHTSVTSEATRAMMELKNRRKLKDERVQRRVRHRGCSRLTAQALKRERRARSSSLASQEEASSEEGEISARDSWRQPSPSRGRARDDHHENREVDVDSLPANYQELNAARVSRYELVEMMFKDQFEETVKSTFYVEISTNIHQTHTFASSPVGRQMSMVSPSTASFASPVRTLALEP